MRLAWLTDIHLNFIADDERNLFYQDMVNDNYDAILISGDIAEAPSLTSILIEMATQINKPIYFILGNHDYYRSQITEVREAVTLLTKMQNQLFWLPASGMQALNKNTILLGQDGWADGRLGDYQNSRVSLNECRMITELFQAKILGKSQLLQKMQQLADADAMQLHKELIQVMTEQPKMIIVLTHVPPFREACLHNGQVSDENWLPYFSSKVMGDILAEAAQQNPAIKFLVLCGHTHSEALYQPLDNLTIKVGKAEYYQPQVQEIILI